jgi:hypothetical protein
VPTGWPPDFPVPFPPIQFSRDYWEELNRRQILDLLPGMRILNPTQAERSLLAGVRCDEGHTVTGKALERTEDGARWLVAICDVDHDPIGQRSRPLFVPFPPYYLPEFSRG